jgi:hypothetical protein
VAIALALGISVALSQSSLSGGKKTTVTTTTYTVSNPGSMSFAVLDQSISYGIPSYNTQAEQQADLSMLVSTGAQCIRVDIGFGPWLDGQTATQSLINSTISSIKATGKCLIIADAASETYRNGGAIPWSQFKVAWVQRVSTLAALYHPTYYIVIKEPGWYSPFVSDATTNPLYLSATDWVGLTQNLTSAVLAASPSTKVGVSVAAGSINKVSQAFFTQYLNGVQAVSGLSFIGLDIYGQTGQTAAENYLTANHPQKAVWIAETWSSPFQTTLGQAQSDAQWITSIYQFGHSIGATMLMPFFTNLFSGYTVPTSTNSLITFYQGRTPAFTQFSAVVAGTLPGNPVGPPPGAPGGAP